MNIYGKSTAAAPTLLLREAQSGSQQKFYKCIKTVYNNTVKTIEWQLWSGAGGMAAQMGHARIKGQLDRIAQQHKWQLTLYKGERRYTVRVDLTDEQYTLLCLQWQIRDGFERWRVVEENSSS